MTKKIRLDSKKSGFTLIEVTITLFIITIFFYGVSLFFSKTITGSQKAKQKTIAANLAQEKIEELKILSYPRLMVTPDNDITTSGHDTTYYTPEYDIQVGGISFSRYVAIKKVIESANQLIEKSSSFDDTGLKKIVVTVTWKDNNSNPKSLSLYNLLDNPNRKAELAGIQGRIIPIMMNRSHFRVFLLDTGASVYTDANNEYFFPCKPGTYPNGIKAIHQEFHSNSSGPITVNAGAITTVDVSLIWMQSGELKETIVYKADHIVISEICASLGVIPFEYIELYNPMDHDYDLSIAGNELAVRHIDSTNTRNNWPGIILPLGTSIIFSHGYFLLAAEAVPINGVVPDAKYELTNNNIDDILPGGIILENVSTGETVDAVGWGNSVSNAPALIIQEEGFFNLDPAGPGLGNDSSLERRCRRLNPSATTYHSGGISEFLGNGYDEHNNTNDFVFHDNNAAGCFPQATSTPLENPAGATPIKKPFMTSDDPLYSFTSGTNSLYQTGIYVATGTWKVYATSNTLYGEITVTIPNPGYKILNQDVWLTTTTTYGHLEGRTRRYNNPIMLYDMVVKAGSYSTYSDSLGRYRLHLPEGTYELIGNLDNADNRYTESRKMVTVTAGQRTVVNVLPKDAGRIKGLVTSNGIDPIPDVTVIVKDNTNTECGSAITDVEGKYFIKNLSSVNTNLHRVYPLVPLGVYYSPANATILISAGNVTEVPTITISDSNFAYGNISGNITVTNIPITTGVLIVASTSTITNLPDVSTATVNAHIYFSTISKPDGTYSITVPESLIDPYIVHGWYSIIDDNNTVTTTNKNANAGTVAASAAINNVNIDW